MFHDGPDELAELLAPCVVEAVSDGDGVLACAPEPAWRRLEARLGAAASEVQFIPDEVRYARPAVAMRMLHEFARDRIDAGAGAAMSIGAIPFADDPIANEDWIRYEAAIEDVLGHLPLRGVCTYDLATTPGALLEGARHTHSTALDAAGRHRLGPGSCPTRSPIDLPDETPALRTTVTSARDARELITETLGADLDREARDTLRIIVSELVTNAIRHGLDPVVLSAWPVAPSSSIVDVSDCGPGIADPFFELRPPPRRPGGAGLWLVGQFAQRVTSTRLGGSHHVTALVTHPI